MKSAKKAKIDKKKDGVEKNDKMRVAAVKKDKIKKIAPKPLIRIASGLKSKILNAKAVGEAIENHSKSAEVAKQIEQEFEVKKTKIKIIGIGGGGGNIVSEIADKIKKSSFCITNTDFQALRNAPKNVTIFQFGEKFTHGLGTGMDARIAEEAANDEREKIKKLVEGQDLVIIVSSLGGGTGSGAAPVFAQISKSLGNLTYGIFTLPFVFEGAKKEEIARLALEKLKPYMNALTVLPNERVFEVVPKNTPFSKTLSYINTMLSDSLEGLIETIYDTGIINIDFADLRAILAGNGKMAFLNNISFKKGEETNLDSFEKAFSSPLYPYTIDKARGLLLNIVAQKDLKLLEVNKILTSVAGRIHKDARIIFGVGHEGAVGGEVKVTVLATGCIYGDMENVNKELPDEKKEEKEKSIIFPVKVAPKKVIKKNKPVKKNKQTPAKTVKKTTAVKKVEIKKEIPAKTKNEGSKDKIIQNIEEFIAAAEPKTEDRESKIFSGTLEGPVRKNAIQVKKEVEMEERAMLEKEKVWDVPAFLRKQQK